MAESGIDTAKKISGPLWVRGRILIVGSDGVACEVRNRVTLCRCGISSKRLLCDSAHTPISFKDRWRGGEDWRGEHAQPGG